MELASMLAGERFTDRPRSVCPVIGALLREYNDLLDSRRRQDLFRYAADCVGTRGSYALQHERAVRALVWARARYTARSRRWGRVREPSLDDGPEAIAAHVLGSVRRVGDAFNAEVLSLIDDLISMGSAEPSADPAAGKGVLSRHHLPQAAHETVGLLVTR
jgi:hypothetical protein